MTERYNPEMLILAREAARLTQADLAALTPPYDQSNISRMESDQLQISSDAARAFSKVLNVPESFFTQNDPIYGLGASFLYHRKRQTMKIPDLRKIEADANIIRMQLAHMLRGLDWNHENTIIPMEVGMDGTTYDIAKQLRAAWRLPSGPIRNLTAAIENANGFVIYHKYHIPTVDGVHVWITKLPAIFILNPSMPGDRVRWTLAHELGHAVMHRCPRPEIEKEADEFASEFLMPAKDIYQDLRDLTLAKAAGLKITWKVSIQALVRRAKSLDLITDGKYRSLNVQISKNGFKKNEPNEIPREEATSVQRLVANMFHEYGHTLESVSALARTKPDAFKYAFLDDNSAPQLRLAN